MDKLTAIAAGVGTLEKFIPVVEAVGKDIGPFVETEITDGKTVWADVLKAWSDFKAAVAEVKAAVPATTSAK